MNGTNSLRRILTDYKRIAIVGLSADRSRPSNSAAKYLLEHGFEVVPVNPKFGEILGQRCYPDLNAIPTPVDIVNLFRRPEHVPPVVDAAIDIGARVVWMQLGIMHEEAAANARAARLEVVMDRCIKIEHARLISSLNPYGLSQDKQTPC